MAQNMVVMANDLGLASCPMTFHDEACSREVLGLPDDLTSRWVWPSDGPGHRTRTASRRPGSP